MNTATIQATIASASAARKLSTVSSILWALGQADTRENIATVRASLRALRASGFLATHTIGLDIAYSAR